MISTMSVTRQGIIPSSRCSVISPSGIISKTGDRAAPGTLITKEFGLAKDRLMITIFARTTKPRRFGRRLPDCRRCASSVSKNPTISGRWAILARAAPVRRFSMIMASIFPAGRPGSPDADGDRFIEIWNLVFMQFDRSRKERVPLPAAVDRYRHGAGARSRR